MELVFEKRVYEMENINRELNKQLHYSKQNSEENLRKVDILEKKVKEKEKQIQENGRNLFELKVRQRVLISDNQKKLKSLTQELQISRFKNRNLEDTLTTLTLA